MPVHAFDQTRADIADFLVQNPGNFRFTTSIENDALTLSFHSSLPPSNDIADNDNIPSPAYSPVNWDELSVDLESAPSDPFNPQARAGSQASVGIPSADPLPNGVPTSGFFAGDLGGGNGNWAGESFFNSNRLQNLTETLSVAPTLSLGMDDDALPIIRLMPNGLYALDATSDTLPIPPPSYNTFDPPNVTLGLGHAHSPNTSLGSMYSHSPSVLGHPNATLMSNASFGSTFSHSPSVLGHPNATLMSNAFLGSTYSHSPSVLGHPNVSLMSNASFGSTFSHSPSVLGHPNATLMSNASFGSTFSHSPSVLGHPNATLMSNASLGSTYSHSPSVLGNPNATLTSNASLGSTYYNTPSVFGHANPSPTSDASFGSSYADGTHAHVYHSSNPSFGLPNGDHPYAAASHMANGSFGFANSVSSMDLGNNDAPPMANTSSPIYLPEHTATLPTCDTCNVLSAFNEPCIDSDSTVVHDMDPGSLTDSMIPRIDALLDIDRVRDSSQDKEPRAIVKEETELEEGEIRETDELTNDTFHGVTALNGQTNHIEGTRFRSSTASTPPSVSPRIASPLVHSFDDVPVNVFYINSATEHSTDPSATEPAHPYIVTPPNSERRLSPIIEEYMPSLIPSRPFSPEPDIRNDEQHSPTPPPMMGAFPYHGITRSDGRTQISFDGLTQQDAEAHLTTERAKYNDYHSVYIPNVAHAIDSFNFCQDGLIAADWDMAQFQDGTYGGHPVIPGETKLPTGGPRSPRTWHERVREIRDHRAHSRHLINVVETVLSTRMLAEASSQANVISCDQLLHIEGGLAPAVYKGRYKEVNPFFSRSESKRLNSYAAIAEHHGEPQLASKIIEALLMPYPDEDTVSALVESRLLDVGAVRDILRMALDRDLVLGIARTGLHVIPTSPFYTESFENPFYSKRWYSVSDIFEDPVEEPKTKGKKFFL